MGNKTADAHCMLISSTPRTIRHWAAHSLKLCMGRSQILDSFRKLNQPARNPGLQAWPKERGNYSSFLKQHLARAQAKMKFDADNNMTQKVFTVGDSVFVK
jgi:hypothetical protein